MLFDDLKKAKMMAMKEHNQVKRSALEQVISKSMLLAVELKAKGEELKDNDVLQIIQKTIKELQEELESFKAAGRDEDVNSLALQIEAIKEYLPKQLSKEEIINIINTLPSKNVPDVMKHFKTQYQGQVDMKLVNQVLKEM
jgi:uncharacterized protein YqeY